MRARRWRWGARGLLLATAGVLTASCSSATQVGGGSTATTRPASRVLSLAEARRCATIEPASWMGCLVAAEPAFGSTALTAMAIPGAHDSGTFALDTATFDTQSGSDCTSYSPAFAGAAPLVERWSKTQDLDYPGQLDGGIRYLDVRVAYAGSAARGWRIVHTFFSADPLATDMASVATWARAHPSEVVIVDLQHVCYDNAPTAAADDELWAELAPLAAVAYDPSAGAPAGSATLDDVVRQGGGGHNVVLLVPAGVRRPSDLLAHDGVHATFTVPPGLATASGTPAPTVVEEYAWPSTVGPVSPAGEDAADAQLAAYPTTLTPPLGSLQGRGFYQSQLIYSIDGSNELSALSTFGGLTTSFGTGTAALPAWEAGLWDGTPDRNEIVARWGHRLNVVVTDEAEHDGFVAAVVEQNAA